MAVTPATWLGLASLACGALVVAAVGVRHLPEVLLGAAAPLAAAIATWVIVERKFATARDRLTGIMVKLFGAKLVLFAAYVVVAVLFVPMSGVVFVASFTSQYVVLHLLEAVFLRRLFAGGEQADAR